MNFANDKQRNLGKLVLKMTGNEAAVEGVMVTSVFQQAKKHEIYERNKSIKENLEKFVEDDGFPVTRNGDWLERTDL